MTAAPAARAPRDPRLDFFRGAAMLIILIAHIPGNGWLLWIPARFGFSDATEIFVFCSGLASAMAFGAVFATRGWAFGAARIGYRVWQVFWAHVGVFIATVAMLAAINASGVGLPGKDYFREPFVLPFIEDPAVGLIGLLTLTYVPGLFDILPMYLVILALVPFVVALHRAGGVATAAAFCGALWLGANLAAWSLAAPGQGAASAIGARLTFLNLPGSPWDAQASWFFNPFAWQIVFFAGFAFGMGWLRPPAPTRGRIRAALLFLTLCLPFSWFRLYDGLYLPEGSAIAVWLGAARAAIEPLIWKSAIGGLRVAHFLALAYVAWALAGPGGRRLSEPLAPRPSARRGVYAAAALCLLFVTAPWAYLDPLGDHRPPGGLLPAVSYATLGWMALGHVAALVALAWFAAPRALIVAVIERGVPSVAGVLRKVGTQSLAVFMLSIPLSQALGLLLDRIGRDMSALAIANLVGVAILTAAAYLVAWFKSQPWRGQARGAPVRHAVAGSPAE